MILDIETGSTLIVDGNSLCKTVTCISIYDNSLGEFIEVLKIPDNQINARDLTAKISLIPNVKNLNWLIHSYKGSYKSSDKGKSGFSNDGNFIQQVLQVMIRRLLASTNTFILCNSAVKKQLYFKKMLTN